MPVRSTPPRSSNWKQAINQRIASPEIHPSIRKRRFWVSAGLCGVAAAILLGAWLWFYVQVHTDWSPPNAWNSLPAEPIREVVVTSDGVLTRDWVIQTLGLNPQTNLLQVEVGTARARLEKEVQVRSAVVRRRFPDVLEVSLSERVPVVRVLTEDAEGRRQLFVVGRDGYVYLPLGYTRDLLASLPFLDGVRLVRQGDGIAPLPEIEDVARLLVQAQLDTPHLYANWQVVSLAQKPWLEVRSADVGEIIFAPGNFQSQLARLNFLLDQRYSAPEVLRDGSIDLSRENQAAVRLGSSLARSPGRPSPHRP